MDKSSYIYGRNSVTETLTTESRKISKILISKNSSKDSRINDIINLAKEKGVLFQFVPKEKFQEFSDVPHQGILAMISPVSFTDFYEFMENKKPEGFSKIIILDGVEDPHNLGAIIRTAACAGYDAVVFPSRRNAQVSAIVEKTSAGAVNHIPLIQVNSLSNVIDKLKDNDYWIIAADANGKDNYFDVDYTNMNFALIMGAEGPGVSRNILNKSDFVVKIPMLRNFNSLNVSNAAAAIIYESIRQMITK